MFRNRVFVGDMIRGGIMSFPHTDSRSFARAENKAHEKTIRDCGEVEHSEEKLSDCCESEILDNGLCSKCKCHCRIEED